MRKKNTTVFMEEDTEALKALRRKLQAWHE
jgi:hypothetical protein